ncbi:MAG TPA: GlsB/YeaQ/YmgE family stress response membrane protein, partial [Mycobacterium sp.]|nr:GlsB/YeaQ/YmgE family stress response membrane protein [Mycobacterium sp.]
MTITGVITAILIGIVVGVLGRLVLPGRQPI